MRLQKIRERCRGDAEQLDPTPVEIPSHGQDLGDSIRQRVREMVFEEMRAIAEQHGIETPDEADDFDVHDVDETPISSYDLIFRDAAAELGFELEEIDTMSMAELRDKLRERDQQADQDEQSDNNPEGNDPEGQQEGD